MAGYRIEVDGWTMFDSRLPTSDVVNPVLTLELNSTLALNFSLPITSPKVVDIHTMTSTVRVIRVDDPEPLFHGRVLSTATSVDGMVSFVCEGDLAFLCDSVMPPYDFQGTPTELLTLFLTEHNAQVNADRALTVGTVTVTNTTDNLVRSNEEYTNTYEEFSAKVPNSTAGGYVRTRDMGAERAVDWLEVSGPHSTQELVFGDNIIDLLRTDDLSGVATAILPLGAVIEGSDPQQRVDITSVHGSDTLIDYPSEAVYGRITATVTWDDVTTPEVLLVRAQAWLDEARKELLAVDLRAVDLSLMGVDVDALRVGDIVHVRAPGHGLDIDLPVSAISLSLVDASQTTVTVGGERRRLSSAVQDIARQAAYEAALRATDGVQERITGVEERLEAELEAAKLEIDADMAELDQRLSEEITEVTITADRIVAPGAGFNEAVVDDLWTRKIVARRVVAEEVVLGYSGNLVPNGAGEVSGPDLWSDELQWDTDDKPDNLAGSWWCAPGAQTVDIRPGIDGSREAVGWEVQGAVEYYFEIWLKADAPGSVLTIAIESDEVEAQARVTSLTQVTGPTVTTSIGGAAAMSWLPVPGELSAANGGYFPVYSLTVPTVWTRYSAVGTLVSGTSHRVYVSAAMYNQSGGSASVGIAGLRVRPRTGSNLIVDGAILARHIIAGAIETDKLAASAITSDKIAAGAITAGKIDAAAITVGAIAPGAVTASALASGAVTTGAIASGSVTSVQIADGAVVADKIQANAIDGMTITGATIRTAASGARTELTSTGLEIYDANAKRISIGPSSQRSNIDFYSASGAWVGYIRGNDAQLFVTAQSDAYQPAGLRLNQNGDWRIGGTNSGMIECYAYGVGPNELRISAATYSFFGMPYTSAAYSPVVYNNQLWYNVSLRKYKDDIQDIELDDAYRVLDVPARHWVDKATASNGRRTPGVVAEEVVDAGLDMFTTINPDTNELSGVAYDRLPVLLIPVVKDLAARVKALEEMV